MNNGSIKEIDRGRWRGKDEEYHAYYSDRRYAKDSIAKAPQAVVKVIGARSGVAAVRGTIEYIAREDGKNKEALTLETQDGELIKGKEAIGALVDEWKHDFERRKFKDDRLPRHATHILLSADCEPNEANWAKLQTVARDFLQREFADKGYEYVFVVHTDTQHPHIHIVVKNKQRDMGLEKRRKLRLIKQDLLHLRRQFAFELEKNGIEQVATRTIDDPKRCLEALNARIEGVRKNMTWYQSRMQEPDWNKEAVTDLRKYSANLQREITRVREIAKESRIPRAERKRIDKEFKEITKTIGALRDTNKAESVKQSVDLFMKRAKEGIIKYETKLASVEPKEPKDLAVEIMNIDKPSKKMIEIAGQLSKHRAFELKEEHLENKIALGVWIDAVKKLPIIGIPTPKTIAYAEKLSEMKGFELQEVDRLSMNNLSRYINAANDLPSLPTQKMIDTAQELEQRLKFELRETDKLDAVVLGAWIKEANKLPLPDQELEANTRQTAHDQARDKIDLVFVQNRDRRSEIYDRLQQPAELRKSVSDKIDRNLSLTSAKINEIDSKLTEIVIQTAKLDEMANKDGLEGSVQNEIKPLRVTLKELEKEIKKAEYHKILKREQLSRIMEIKRDLGSIYHKCDKVTNEFGLDMRMEHLQSAKKQGEEALTAREMIKEANAGIVTIERQIIEAENVIKDVKESGINSKERREHIKSLETIRDRFLEGYSKHIKESGKLVEGAIEADRKLKSIPPPERKGERDRLNKTMESYLYSLEKSARFSQSRLNAIERFSLNSAIKAQSNKIERNFSIKERA